MLLALMLPAAGAQPAPEGSRRAPSSGGEDDAVNSTLETLLDFSSETGPAPAAEPEETNVVKRLHKKSLELRDPFWPVGYTPPKKDTGKKKAEISDQPAAPAVVERPPRWDDALRTVSVRGIMSVGEGKYMAVVNDNVVSENDVVTINFEGRTYTWKIASISADGVKFQKLDVIKPAR